MNTLLRIYLVLIFASGTFDAGSENDTINWRFRVEAANFANPKLLPNVQERVGCFTSRDVKKYILNAGVSAEIIFLQVR